MATFRSARAPHTDQIGAPEILWIARRAPSIECRAFNACKQLTRVIPHLSRGGMRGEDARTEFVTVVIDFIKNQAEIVI